MAKKDAPGKEQALDSDEGVLMNGEEEIIDLLEVVKPGKAAASDAESGDVDFSQDLESMLDTLSAAEQAKASAFPDPTPVDHEVDHNESLDLPDMGDLDNLLESLGADAAKKETPGGNDAVDAEADGEALELDAAPLAGARQKADDPDEFAALLNALEKENAQAEAVKDAGQTPEALDPALTSEPSFEANHDGLPDADGDKAAPPPEEAPAAPVEEFLEDAFGAASPEQKDAEDGAPGQNGAEDGALGQSALEEEAADDDPFAAALAAAAKSSAPADAFSEGASGSGRIADEETLDQDAFSEDVLDEAALFDADNLDTAKGDIASEGLDVETFNQVSADAAEEGAEEDELFSADELSGGEVSGSAMTESFPAEAASAGATAPASAADASAHGGSGLDEVDLVELDALLDDMLAGAPASGPGFTESQPQDPRREAPATDVPPSAAPAVAGDDIRGEASGLREEVEALRRELHESLTALAAGGTAGFGGRLEDLELTMAAKTPEDEERARTLQLHTDRLGLLDGRLEVVEEACERLDALEARMSGLETRLEEMNANLDKVAAEAAARVIREELAALMADQQA